MHRRVANNMHAVIHYYYVMCSVNSKYSFFTGTVRKNNFIITCKYKVCNDTLFSICVLKNI